MIGSSDFRTLRIPLNHGAGQIPALGFGTLIPDAAVTKTATRGALEAGFRHFDCTARNEDAAHFLIRQVHAHPHQVTIFAAGPLTNIALAISIDPEFAALTKGPSLMGGSLTPTPAIPNSPPARATNSTSGSTPRPCTLPFALPGRASTSPPSISREDAFYAGDAVPIAKSPNPAAQYIAKYSQDRYYMWDELTAAAWLDPTIITAERQLYMDVDINHGPTYGDTLTWTKELEPQIEEHLVHAQTDLDLPKFSKMFVDLMSAPTPGRK